MRVRTGMERLLPPQEYADFVARCGGSNLFGKPLFMLFWGQTYVRPGSDGPELLGHGTPAWMLGAWHPPDDYADRLWDKTLGPFPPQGEYEVLQPFYRREGKKIEHMPLNYRTLEMMIPVTLKHKGDSFAKRMAFLQDTKAEEERVIQDQIADRLQDSVPSWEAGSFPGITNTNSALRQKMEQIEKNYRHILAYRQQKPMGPSLGGVCQ